MISYKEFKEAMSDKLSISSIEREEILNYIYNLFEEKATVPHTSRIKCCGENDSL